MAESAPQYVSLTIDGQSVSAPKGTPILEAAKQIGIQIPYYCYHPGLTAVGSCRMCLVEIEKIPKLQPSCATPVAEGMVVRTQTADALRNRQSVLEFLLLNHPLDCPVCDQAGECELQNYYMDHGVYDPRFNENKTKRRKAFPIGPTVVLDQERCILCTRCVRFTHEVTRTFELGVHDRGHLSEIDLFPGMQLENPYSGNVVDICPVGALTDRDFRFQCRVWFLGSAPSICPGCSRGCNIEVHYNTRFNPQYHDKRVQRLKPRHNAAVNGHWMCDEGRYAYHALDAPQRLQQPLLREADGFRTTTWDEALGRAADSLRRTLDERGAGAVGVLASPQMTNEELFRMRQLFGDRLGVTRTDYRVPRRGEVYADDFLVTADKNPNSRGAEVLGWRGAGTEALLGDCAQGKVDFLYVGHHDLLLGFDADVVEAALTRVGCVVYQGSWENRTAGFAHVVLPAAAYAENAGTFTNVQGRVQRIFPAVAPLGESLPGLEVLARLAARLGLGSWSSDADETLAELAATVPAFTGMSGASVGLLGQPLAAADAPR